MEKVKTSLHKLREGVAFKEKQVEVRFPPAGHLHVELRDASGTLPLVHRKVSFDVPETGSVERTTDALGRFIERDVPFAEYELTIEDGGKVKAPAVASPHEHHICVVPDAKLGWIDLEILDHHSIPVGGAEVRLDGESLEADGSGLVSRTKPLPENKGKKTIQVGDAEVDVELPAFPRRTIVRLPKREDS